MEGGNTAVDARWVRRVLQGARDPGDCLLSDRHSEHLWHDAAVTMDQLFEEEPEQWGLRGDPYVWAALRQHLAGRPLPNDKAKLEASLLAAFTSVVGADLRTEQADQVYRREFAHGGMSSGHVSLPTWRDSLIPLLVRRGQPA